MVGYSDIWMFGYLDVRIFGCSDFWIFEHPNYLFFLEVFFANTAEGADPVGGDVFKFGAWGDAVVGVAFCGVILIPADVTNILFHIVFVFWG